MTVKVLLVDDEADICTVFKKGLTRRGFEVDAFKDPREALENFFPSKYDFALLDIKMPQMNGFELFRALRKKDPKIKVNFLTAFDFNVEDESKVMLDLGIQFFIKKPIGISTLANIISSNL